MDLESFSRREKIAAVFVYLALAVVALAMGAGTGWWAGDNMVAVAVVAAPYWTALAVIDGRRIKRQAATPSTE